MKFTVITADNAEKYYEGTYKVGEGGVLTITPVADYKPITRLSPAFWREVSEPRGNYGGLGSGY